MTWLRFIPETTNIDFVGWRYWAFAIDGLLLVASIISIVVQGFNLGIDFTGGVQLEIKSERSIDIGEIRPQLDALKFREVKIQNIATDLGSSTCNKPANSCALIRVSANDGQPENEIVPKIKQVLGSGYTYRNTEIVGPKVSQELFRSGVYAMIAAVAAIAFYVAIRFEWQFGIGAFIATGHDVFVTAGFFSIIHMDFTINTVAALLLLAGYSINDTVVVFDRIRENRRKYKRMPLTELINLSTNQIATRTTLVSAATALSVLPLLFGGPVLLNFSTAILFGILVGTFSSTYVAAALLLYLPPLAGQAVGEVAPAE
jgi:preprotein translocase SecF subunit